MDFDDALKQVVDKFPLDQSAIEFVRELRDDMDTEPFVIAEEYTKHLPARAVAKLEKWINRGGDLSGFWHYLLSGDYGSAACNADPELLASFGWMLRFLEQSAPSDSFGSPENVENWRGVLDKSPEFR